jgi:hypothetical protein
LRDYRSNVKVNTRRLRIKVAHPDGSKLAGGNLTLRAPLHNEFHEKRLLKRRPLALVQVTETLEKKVENLIMTNDNVKGKEREASSELTLDGTRGTKFHDSSRCLRKSFRFCVS